MLKSKKSGTAVGVLAGLAFFLSGFFAQAADVSLKRNEDEVVITASVQDDFAGTEASISAPEAGTVEVLIPGADFGIDGVNSRRQLFRFDDSAIKTVSLTKEGSSGILRFNLKDNNASMAAEQIQISRSEKQVRIEIPTKLHSGATPLTGVKSVTIVNAPTATQASATAESSEPQEKLTVRDAAKDATDGKEKQEKPGSTGAAKNVAKDTRPESEIPVFASTAQEKKSAGVGIERLVLTLFVVCVVLAAALFGIKRWGINRKGLAGSNTKIQILTQHHLGPKKSLAIVQVAGEAILIGITDQNISMLKTLALIDDEVPGLVPKNFSDELENDANLANLEQEGFEPEPEEPVENFAMKGLGEVRDLVSTKFTYGSRGRSSRKDV